MTDLAPMTALGGMSARVETLGPVTLTENSGLALASLAISRGQMPPAPFGLHLPDVGKMTAHGDVFAFWTGPGQWMIAAEGKAEMDFARAVQAETDGGFVTEQTDGFVCFELDAPAEDIARLLSKLVNIDAAALAPGSAVRTGLEHMTVLVLRPGETRLAVLGMRSFAGSLWHALATAARRMNASV